MIISFFRCCLKRGGGGGGRVNVHINLDSFDLYRVFFSHIFCGAQKKPAVFFIRQQKDHNWKAGWDFCAQASSKSSMVFDSGVLPFCFWANLDNETREEGCIYIYMYVM